MDKLKLWLLEMSAAVFVILGWPHWAIVVPGVLFIIALNLMFDVW